MTSSWYARICGRYVRVFAFVMLLCACFCIECQHILQLVMYTFSPSCAPMPTFIHDICMYFSFVVWVYAHVRIVCILISLLVTIDDLPHIEVYDSCVPRSPGMFFSINSCHLEKKIRLNQYPLPFWSKHDPLGYLYKRYTVHLISQSQLFISLHTFQWRHTYTQYPSEVPLSYAFV